MTLCVAWKKDDNIHFASDSRISYGDKHSDYGLKLIPVPIKIQYPYDRKEDCNQRKFEKTYGLGFTGSFTGAYIIREFLMIVLQRLQFVPDKVDVSFNQICKIINKFYTHLVHEIKKDLVDDHSIDFFLSGFCPNEKVLKFAKFYIDYGPEYKDFIPKCRIYNDKIFLKAIGTGEEDFFKFFNQNPNKNYDSRVITSIKQLIKSQIVKSVGGNIQYAKFNKNNDFETYGIIENQYNEHGLIEVKHLIAGINMNGDEFEQKIDELYISGSYLTDVSEQIK